MVYRDMDGRSMSGAAAILGRDKADIDRMAKRYTWEERALAWDAEVQRRIDKAEMDEIVRMARRQTSIAVGMQTVVAHEVGCLLEQIRREEYRARMDPTYERVSVVKPSVITKMAEVASKLERVARGEPSDITKSIPAIDPDKLSNMSTDELEALDKLLKMLS
jgi:hypothetical protein